jgi:drug/metabolite transporter (DMT)-like permease
LKYFSRSRPTATPVIVACLVMLIWGATPVVTKVATGEIDSILVGVLRTLVAGAMAAPLLRTWHQPLPVHRQGLALLVVSSLAGFIAFPILFSIGQRHTSAMHGGLILAALPIFTGSYAALLEWRRPGLRWILGCLLALAGELALIAFRAGAAGAEVSLLGDALVVLSALLVASGYVAGGRLGQLGYTSLATTFWGVSLAAGAVAPVAGILLWADGTPRAGLAAWGCVLFLAVMTTIVGYIGWYWALAAGGIARIGTIQFFQPVSGLVLATVVLGERFTLPLLVASVTILAGVSIAQRA